MPIQVVCTGCKKTLRVADKHAGKRAKCPNCQQVIEIPAASGDAESPAAMHDRGLQSPSSTSPKQESGSSDQWYVQTESGEQFGPISRNELDVWVSEGRVDSSCQVLQEHWDQWKWAEEVYPQLAHSAATVGAQFAVKEPSAPTITISETKRSAATLTAEVNPFASPKFVGESHEAEADGLTRKAKQSLAETRPWVFFFSVLAFVGSGFGGLGGIGMFIAGITQGGATGVGSLVSGVMFLGGAALYGFAAYHLYSYASYIKLFLKTSSPGDLEQALTAQKSFWKLVGIVTAVFLILYAVLFLLVIVLGLAG
mgnify:CR=1 FL=1